MNQTKTLVSAVLFAMTPLNPNTSLAATVADRLDQYGAAARARLSPHFAKQKVTYPPGELVLVGFKKEKTLEVYAKSGTSGFRLICNYPILAASGTAGPKLREGDRQVPEGIYAIEFLNPNSRYHLSLRVNYPNAFDRKQALEEKRTNLGGDIMIHGKAASIGCLAMGDEAAEDLFVLAADTGLKNITVILAPLDFRKHDAVPGGQKLPPWTVPLYDQVRAELRKLPGAKE
jgi:murein L,D-transpeptidase YafK